MNLTLDPQTIGWILIGAASFCAFMIGQLWGSRKVDQTINNTILWLAENDFVKTRTDENGEIELIPLTKKKK